MPLAHGSILGRAPEGRARHVARTQDAATDEAESIDAGMCAAWGGRRRCGRSRADGANMARMPGESLLVGLSGEAPPHSARAEAAGDGYAIHYLY